MQITQTTASFFKSKVNINLFYLVLQKYIILEYNASLFCVSREDPTLQQMPGGRGAELPPVSLP